MELQKVILYYGFTPIADPQAVMLWQKTLCESLNLKGRILVSPHGINGTVGGDMSALKKYVKQTKKYPGFRKIDFKWSQGTGNEFPRLSVKAKKELVAFGNPDEIKVDENGVIGGGIHLKPFEVNKLVEERGDDVVFFDGRNAFEAKIGKFKNAVVPDVTSSQQFVAEIESGKYDHLKDKPIVTYCTGGIRCEVLSVVMKNRGFNESTRSMAASFVMEISLAMMASGKVRSIPLMTASRLILRQTQLSSVNAMSAKLPLASSITAPLPLATNWPCSVSHVAQILPLVPALMIQASNTTLK